MQKPRTLRNSIKLNNLTFTYQNRPQKPAIRNLSLRIQLRTSTAVIGASGSGKTTIISLLLGLYAPSIKEAITISSYALSDFHIPTLRTFIAFSPQHPPIFPVSIKANIAYALSSFRELCSMKNIVRAAKLAGIHAFINSLQEGYDTLIGEGGSLLSGGQTARIGLARAICRRPEILLLDEPTAALDGISRAELIRVIRGLVRDGVTVVVVTHDEVLRNSCEFVVEIK